MCSDSEKNMSAYADQNHAPSLTYVRLEHSDLCYYMRFLSVRQAKSIPLNQQFTFTELEKTFHLCPVSEQKFKTDICKTGINTDFSH